ncbi:MAG TPA: histidine phosphatase family protein [Planctomycetota bacterium]|jgi:phosphohistidine phosphatase|nr:histidine phosphatase family protein [Planctomycetota bacterium]
MELFLFRHAEAEPRSGDAPDERRALTAKGRERFLRAAKGLERLEIQLDRIYHSPWLRSIESAELLSLLLDGETVVTPLLAQPPTRELLDILEGENVALVGHEPWLSDLLGWLVFGVRMMESDGKSPCLDFGKGGLAWVGGKPEPGAMSLRAFLPPRALRRIGRS